MQDQRCQCAFCSKGYDDAGFRDFIGALETTSFIHVFIGELQWPAGPDLCFCGVQREQDYLRIPTPAGAPNTPIVGHIGRGCVATWLHNADMMRSHGLEPKPLPCSDAFCNAIWTALQSERK